LRKGAAKGSKAEKQSNGAHDVSGRPEIGVDLREGEVWRDAVSKMKPSWRGTTDL
jgi:hypothetical protein